MRRRGRNSGLDAQLAVVQARTPSLDWWAETLNGLAHRGETRELQPRLQQFRSLLADDQPTHALLLDSGTAQAILRKWSTWARLSVMAGQPVQERVQGLKDDLAVKMVQVEEKKASTDVLIAEVTVASEKAAEEEAAANVMESAFLTAHSSLLKTS